VMGTLPAAARASLAYLYCAARLHVNSTCIYPYSIDLGANSAQNKAGGDVTIDAYFRAFGYTSPAEGYSGATVGEGYVAGYQGYPRAWNRGGGDQGGYSLIHARFSSWIEV